MYILAAYFIAQGADFMSSINIYNLTFAYEGTYDNIFENVSFQMDTDWKLGFTGRNGRGKTTFLNLLLGKYEYKGTISATVQFDYFPFQVDDNTLITMEIIEDLHPDCAYWEIKKELNLLQVDEDVLYRPFNTLSQGEQTKVLLAVLFLREHHFLLIDEPTNHLDVTSRHVVCNYLNNKKGFILVSHDRAFLDGCTDHMLAINKTNIEIQKGNFSSWYHNKTLQDQFELAENERLKKHIKRLTAAAKQTARWADKVESSKIGMGKNSDEKSIDHRCYVGEKSRRMQQRRKNLERRQQSAIEEKSSLLKNIESTESLKLLTLPFYTTQLLRLLDVTLSYDTKVVCEKVRFEVSTGDRICLQGKNGCGKSSVLKFILGEYIDYTGTFNKASGLKISYISQDTSHLKGNLSDYARDCNIDETLFKSILRKLDFARVQFEKDIASFSEGQKKKVLIAKSLSERAHLYIWDEPLNFIDIFSRIQIEQLLLAYQPTLIFVEHDESFTQQIATEIIAIG